jgi:hypothetical protein
MATAVAIGARQVGTGALRPADADPQQRGGVVIGTVVDATTGVGIAGAAVTIRGASVALAIETDPLGRYYFVALPAGGYDVVVTRTGYADGRYGQMAAGGDPQQLRILPGEWRVDADVRLWRHAAITGIVIDESGEPVIGVRVNAMRRDRTASGTRIVDIATDLTDDRGRFRIGRLVPGEYLVMTPSVQVSVGIDVVAWSGASGNVPLNLMALLAVGARQTSSGETSEIEELTSALVPVNDETFVIRGVTAVPPPATDEQMYAYPTQYFPAVDIPSLALAVPVEAGQEFFGVAFTLRPVPAADISGVVTGPAGAIDGQLLRLVPDTGEDFGAGFEAALTVSAPDGRFRFRGVPAGAYVIEARAARSLEAMSPNADVVVPPTDLRRAQDEWWSRVPVTVFREPVGDVAVALQPTMSVTGRIVFESSAGLAPTEIVERIRVGLRPVAGGRAGVADARPLATGSFALHGVLPARYYLDVDAPAGWHVEAATGLGRDLTSDPINASAGGDLVIAIRMTDGGTQVRGTVRDERGMPADDTVVVVFPADREALPPMRTRQARVSASGEFSIAGLPPGAYRIVAIAARDAPGWQDPARLDGLRASATGLTLAAGERRIQDLRIRGRR